MSSRIDPSSISYHGFVPPCKSPYFLLPIVVLTLLFYFLPLSNAYGEIIEIPLPELVGIYTMDDTPARTVSFDFGHPVTEVHQARIQWAGSITPGEGIHPPPLPSFPWPCQVYASMDTSGISYWNALFGPVEGSFQDTTTFEGVLDPTWDFLSDGIGELTVGLLPEVYGGSVIMGSSPIVQLDSVSIIFDVDLATGLGNTATWGEIKARYRKNSTAP